MVGGDVVDGVSGYLARVEDDAEPESSKRAAVAGAAGPNGLLRSHSEFQTPFNWSTAIALSKGRDWAQPKNDGGKGARAARLPGLRPSVEPQDAALRQNAGLAQRRLAHEDRDRRPVGKSAPRTAERR